MTVRRADYTKAVDRAAAHAQAWLDSVGVRPVKPEATADELLRVFGGRLPQDPMAPDQVIDLLADGAGSGLMAMPSGRFFGWVIGGTLPAALAADWLVSAWDQFGLWAAASPALRHLMDGVELADSWATDAHKTLNVPYDCGVAIVADPAAMRAALGTQANYLIQDDTGPGDPFEKVPELSRRARGVPVWAALRSLGRDGVVRLVDGLVARAQALAAGIAEIDGAEVLNDVDYTQVCVAFGDDARTRAVTERLIADGLVWMSGSQWHGRDVVRISVSNWSTDDEDVRWSLDAVRRAALVPAPS